MKKKILLIIIVLFLLSAKPTFAASLLFDSSIADGHVGLHQMFKVNIRLDPEGQVINGLEAHISYPHDLLKLSGIEDGSSFLSMWLERAHEGNGNINLSGIVPGGFGGSIAGSEYSKFGPGDVVTLIFDPIKAGVAVVGVASSTALLNDGVGTKAFLKNGSVAITIGDYLNVSPIANTDVISPDFIYAESHYDSALAGQYLFFAASDKDSGVDHYEIKVGDVWQTIQSPYLINQDGGVYYIKAIDRAGNERIKEIPVAALPSDTSGLVFWSAVVLASILIILVGRFTWIKRNKKQP